MIFVICNEKGGVGKSSIAQSLAGYFMVETEKLILVDADPQGTTSGWADTRRQNAALQPISCVSASGDLRDLLRELGTSAHVVVDCGGSDSIAMRSAMTVADVIIMPFRPKRRDLQVAAEMSSMAEVIRLSNPRVQVYSLVTQAPTLPSQARRTEDAKEVLAEYGLNPLKFITRNVVSWDDAEEEGQTVFEYKGCSKASEDAMLIFDDLMERVHDANENEE